MESAADDEVEKFNPYHDSRGRFASANSATSFTWRPGQGAMYDNAIAREKERHAAGGGTAPEADTPRMKTIHGIEDNIRNQFYESAAVVDKDGNVVFQKSGAANAVGFTKMECFMMRNNTLTHNHPGSSMFSTEDIVCFTQNGMEEIRATTREGTTYSIKRGKDYTQDRAWQFVSQYDGERKIAHRIAQRELDQRGFREKIMDGEITQEYANREFGKVVTREMITYCNKYASQYGLEYSVEKRAVDNKYNLEVFTGKSAGDEEFILDAETNALDDAAFNEWLNQTPDEPAEKSLSKGKSVLFIGAKVSGAGSLAIEGGEDEDEFHVTLAYGHFDPKGADEDAIDVRVQSAIDEIREFIPDEIRFDAIGRFPASEHSDGKDVIYAQVAAGQLEKAHDELLKALKKNGIKLEDTFRVYKPHMTLAYIYPGKLYKLSKINVTGSIKKLVIGHGIESSHENNYTIFKTDEDKRLVFGWASISITLAGEQLEDRQEDIIDPEDLEEAAYEYVLEFRDTGEEHIPSMRKKGKLVESCVFTAEKQKAMGIPEGTVPVGWWIGFKIEDDAAWERVKNGTYKMFSIEGKANRIPIEKSVAGSNYSSHYMDYPSYDMWLEENLDASMDEQKAAEEYFKTHKPVAKSFDEILKTK